MPRRIPHRKSWAGKRGCPLMLTDLCDLIVSYHLLGTKTLVLGMEFNLSTTSISRIIRQYNVPQRRPVNETRNNPHRNQNPETYPNHNQR